MREMRMVEEELELGFGWMKRLIYHVNAIRPVGSG